MTMRNDRSNKHRGNPARALWRWLALALCLAMLLGDVCALAEETQQPQEQQAEEEVQPEPVAEEAQPEPVVEEVQPEPEPQEAVIEPAYAAPVNIIYYDFDGEDNAVVKTISGEPGTAVTESAPEAPSRGGYDFTGWSADLPGTFPDSDLSIYGQWNIKTYTIRFLDDDGTVLQSGSVNHGDTPAYTGGTTPSRASSASTDYTFNDVWSPDIAPATGDQDYTPVFDESTRTYEVTWKDEDGNLIETTWVAYNTLPTHDVPEKAPTAEFDYVGSWDPAPVTVTGTASDIYEYKATYTPQKRSYTITWKLENGSPDDTTSVEYGQKPTHDTPAKAADEQNVYTFAAWSPEIKDVTGEATYTATYNSAPRPYTVTWKLDNGSPDVTASVAYGAKPAYAGATPTKVSDGESLFTFGGWYDESDPDKKRILPDALPTVSGDVTYVASYDAESLTKEVGNYKYKLNPEKTEATILWWNGKGTVEGALTLPDTFENGTAKVIGIADNAFLNNPYEGYETVTSLTLPAGLKTLGKTSVANLQAMTTLVIPDTLESIGEGALTNNIALTTVTLRCTQETTMNSATEFSHKVVVEGVESNPTVTLPMAITDIVVTQNNDPTNNPASLTLSSFTVEAGHSVTVEGGATLTNPGVLTNFGTITNAGTLNNNSALVSCGGAFTNTGTLTNAEGATCRLPGDHNYADGKCTFCGAVLPELSIKYKGKEVTKVYDKTTLANVDSISWSIKDFEIENKDALGLDVDIDDFYKKSGKIVATFDKANVGKRTVTVTLTLKGADAAAFGNPKVTLSGTIEPKPLIITPTAGQKKTFGASDPKTLTGKVKGLMTGDTIKGKLSRETGENAGKYRIVQGTIDAGDNYDVQVLEDYFTIEPKNINASDVGLVTIGNQRYTGEKVEPEITLKFGKNTLKKGTDFKTEFTNNVQPGTASVKITGIGNYTGERESSFRILNIASGGGGSSSSGGGSYSYGGFSDGEGDDEDDEQEEVDPNLGKLIVKEENLGTILFNAAGDPAPFVQFEEMVQELVEGELSAETDENGNPLPWTLTIIPDPLADEETGETLMLESGEREKYDELHLRLTTPMVSTLTSLGCTEIIYELDSAELHIPLAALVAEIPLESEPDGIVGVVDDEGVQEGEELTMEEPVEEVEVDLMPTTLQVSAYDICVEQVEVAGLTDRESAVLEGYTPVTATYKVTVRAVIENETEETTATIATDGENPIVLPEAERLPAQGWPAGMVLRVMPLEELTVDETANAAEEEDETEDASDDETEDGAEDEPEEPVPFPIEGIDALFVPSVEDASVELEPTITPAQFVDVDDIIYAQLEPRAEGLYGVGRPGAVGEEVADFDDSVPSGLSTMGGSFTIGADGKPVLD